MRVDLIAGARPNFMKIAPIIHVIQASIKKGEDISFRLIHTGQHYDKNMSGAFFEQLGIPSPHVNLGAGGGTQSEQTAKIMIGYERLLIDESTDLCLVVGDVNSTMACSIVAKKMNVKVAHVEAGIRSGDLSMPEEINRMVTDSISDYFFTTTKLAGENLKGLGIGEDRIFFVGNTMIDTLLKQKENFKAPVLYDKLKLSKNGFFVMTLHRPANVDEENLLKALIKSIVENSNGLPIIFPVHPRTRKILEGLGVSYPSLHMVEPLGYLEFNYLVQNSRGVVTDSGGITEETTVMGIPCMTLRDNTERPETVTEGTNELLGVNPKAIGPAMNKIFMGQWKKGEIPEKWDGHCAERIVEVLLGLNLG